MTKQREYTISRNHVNLATIPARSYEDAARKWAQREAGKRATAFRTSGDFGKSGYFQAYERLDNGGYTSVYDHFHVWG